MPRHIVLVGLPGSGKSTVGKLVAEALGASLIDIDGLLVREMGMPIIQIFGMLGEAKFREMERDAVNAAQAREPCVIVPGGGWAAQPGQLDSAKQSSLVIYLKCQAGTATKRSEQGEARPLLTGVDPAQRMGSLLEEREPFYRKADHQVDTERVPAEAVAAEVMALARQHGGWLSRSAP
jgi:shikimate kinase